MKRKTSVLYRMILTCLVLLCKADSCDPPPEQTVTIKNSSSISIAFHVTVEGNNSVPQVILYAGGVSVHNIGESSTYFVSARPSADWLEIAKETRDRLSYNYSMAVLNEKDPKIAEAILLDLSNITATINAVEAGRVAKSCTGAVIKGQSGYATIRDGDTPNSIRITCSSSD